MRWSEEVQSLLKFVLLSKNPASRSTVADAQRSRWWADINWRRLFLKQMPPPISHDPMLMMQVGVDVDDFEDIDEEECFVDT